MTPSTKPVPLNRGMSIPIQGRVESAASRAHPTVELQADVTSQERTVYAVELYDFDRDVDPATFQVSIGGTVCAPSVGSTIGRRYVFTKRATTKEGESLVPILTLPAFDFRVASITNLDTLSFMFYARMHVVAEVSRLDELRQRHDAHTESLFERAFGPGGLMVRTFGSKP